MKRDFRRVLQESHHSSIVSTYNTGDLLMIQNTESQVRKRSLISHWGLIYLGEEYKGISIYQAVDSFMGEGNGTPLQCSHLENPMDGGAWWAAVHRVAESDMTEWLHFHFSLSCIGEGSGNPRQCSCLENPREGGAWWDAVCGVAQIWTQLKWLSSSSSRLLYESTLVLTLSYVKLHTLTVQLLSVFDRWRAGGVQVPFWNGLYTYEVDMLSRYVTAPSKGQASFNFMIAVTICSDFWTQENKICHCFHFSLSTCHEVTCLAY